MTVCFAETSVADANLNICWLKFRQEPLRLFALNLDNEMRTLFLGLAQYLISMAALPSETDILPVYPS